MRGTKPLYSRRSVSPRATPSPSRFLSHDGDSPPALKRRTADSAEMMSKECLQRADREIIAVGQVRKVDRLGDDIWLNREPRRGCENERQRKEYGGKLGRGRALGVSSQQLSVTACQISWSSVIHACRVKGGSQTLRMRYARSFMATSGSLSNSPTAHVLIF